jgi:hypothetical protein
LLSLVRTGGGITQWTMDIEAHWMSAVLFYVGDQSSFLVLEEETVTLSAHVISVTIYCLIAPRSLFHEGRSFFLEHIVSDSLRRWLD